MTPCALTSCHVVISKQGDGSASGQSCPTCVTGRPHDMRTTWSDLDRGQRIESRARDMQLIRGISDDTACKGVQVLALHLAPGRRYGTRRSPLFEYMSLHLSLKQTTNCGLLSRINWEIYFYKEVFCSFIEFRKSCDWLQHYTIWCISDQQYQQSIERSDQEEDAGEKEKRKRKDVTMCMVLNFKKI